LEKFLDPASGQYLENLLDTVQSNLNLEQISSYEFFKFLDKNSEEKLGGFMKVLIWDGKKCIGCGTCEEVCSQTWFKDKNRAKSRIKITKQEEGISCNLCDQCGECINVCPVEALTRDKKGIVRLNEKTCVGCLSCVGFCPSKSMFFTDGVELPFKCIACGICVKPCPSGALKLEERPDPLEKVFYRRHF